MFFFQESVELLDLCSSLNQSRHIDFFMSPFLESCAPRKKNNIEYANPFLRMRFRD